MLCCRLEGPRVFATNDAQDVVDARRAAASRINLPKRSFRTVGVRRVFSLFAGRWCAGLGGWYGGFGFGGLAGSSEGG